MDRNRPVCALGNLPVEETRPPQSKRRYGSCLGENTAVATDLFSWITTGKSITPRGFRLLSFAMLFLYIIVLLFYLFFCPKLFFSILEKPRTIPVLYHLPHVVRNGRTFLRPRPLRRWMRGQGRDVSGPRLRRRTGSMSDRKKRAFCTDGPPSRRRKIAVQVMEKEHRCLIVISRMPTFTWARQANFS